MDSIQTATLIKETILSKIDNHAIVKVEDDTHKHAKHKGFIEGKYHYTLLIESEILSQMRKIQSHKAIYSALAELMPNIHALSIKISTKD